MFQSYKQNSGFNEKEVEDEREMEEDERGRSKKGRSLKCVVE